LTEPILLGLLAILSELLGTIGGFGSSLFFVSLAQLLLPFQTVLALTGVLHVFGNINKIILFFNEINWHIALRFIIPTMITVAIGAWLTKYITPDVLEIGLGAFLVVFSILMLFRPTWKVSPKTIYSLSGGAISGFLTGLIGSGGAIRGITMAAFQLEKSTFIATNAMIDFLNDATRTIIYLSMGYLTWDYWIHVLVLFIAAWIGSLIGKWIVLKISQQQFRSIVLILIFVVGIWMMGNNLL
jgi:uncharacterized membrane protein YfcA